MDQKSKQQPSESSLIRLNKFLADSGVCSRRAADDVIAEGRVMVNGKKVFELGIKVNPSSDRITFDGKPIRIELNKVYLAFHKPKGILTTLSDELGRPTIADFLVGLDVRVFPVGRLDWDSEGLLILTNDGDFANKVMQPKSDVTKTYLVKVDGKPDDRQLNKLKLGVSIPGGRVKALSLEKINKKEGSRQYNWLKIVINEGKNRQIRLMFEKIGFDVLKLQRIAIGQLKIGNLERGELTYLSPDDLKKIFKKDIPEVSKAKVVKKASGKKSFKPTNKQNREFNRVFKN